MNKLVIIECDDWQGLYVNGYLETESHRIRFKDIAELTPISDIRIFYLNDEGINQTEECGNLPSELSDIPSDWFYEEDWDDLRECL